MAPCFWHCQKGIQWSLIKKPRKKQEENNENPQIDQSDKNLILHDYLLYSEVGVYLKLRVRNDSKITQVLPFEKNI